jgi:transposase-like protein/predicted RNA-binding Zn-ribbon protein involved in translation (DUF1610 family)
MITVQEFFKTYTDDTVCLEHLFRTRFGKRPVCPKCGKKDKFRRLTKLPAYTCNCGHHIHPMSGTPFQDTRTPLQKWFYAMYLFTTSRHGVPAKELQRQLGITYKCAWRMGHEIRKYMGMVDGNTPLSGTVEADETYIGGKTKGGKRGRGSPNKTIVFGMLQKSGDVMTKIVPNVRRKTLHPHIKANVKKGSIIHTDELKSYRKIASKGYQHETVNHSAGEYARDGVTVNGIEGFWSQVKRSIRGTHVHVSKKHMSKYLGEFEYRHNMRKTPGLMFSRLLASF